MILLEKRSNIGFHFTIYGLVSFKFSLMLKTTEFYILIPVSMTLTFHLRVTGASRKKNFLRSFSFKVLNQRLKCSTLPQPLGLLKLMLSLCHMLNINRRELYLCDFHKYTFNIGWVGILENQFVSKLV